MSELLRFFKDMRDNGYGLAEIAAQLGTSAIAEPVAGFAAMYDPAHGADAIREGMTYTPRTQEAQEYSQSVGNAASAAIKPAMPIIDAWKQGVDIAGRYSPAAGAMLRTVPTAIGIAMGAKPALQAGRQVSKGLESMQGRMIANANAPRTLNTGYMGQRGVFAGINALTADKEALAKADAMIRQGVDPAQVWKETGWGKGVDGKWRFEIDDSSAQFTNDAIKELRNKNGKTQGAIFPHQDLAAAYPESADIWTIKTFGDGASYRGGQMGETDMISLGIPKRGTPDLSELKRTNLHEIQHAIQDREGFARGGMPEQFNNLFSYDQLQDARILANMMRKGKSLEDALQEYKTLIRKEPTSGAATLVRNYPNINDLNAMTHDPYEAYRRLAGEVEARTTESRSGLTAQQRRDNYPFDYKTHGYDVPANYQNIEFDSKNSMSKRPLTEFEQAHLTAQRNAALPVNQGGLGLPADNTAMDRARAMGFDTDVYHGTGADIDSFDMSKVGSNIVLPVNAPRGIYTAKDAEIASRYSKGDGSNVIPLIQKSSGAALNNSKIMATLDPSSIRSRFAAFDPFNRDSSNLLATTAPLVPTTALGAYMYNEKRKKSQGNQ